MANGVFNIAKGKVGYYTDDAMGLAGANSRIVIVVLDSSGLEADDTLNNYDNLSALLAASNNEASSTNYARKQIAAAGITFSVNDTSNAVQTVVDADQTWTAVTGGNAWGKLLVCWDGDNTAGDDTNIVPLTYHDFVVTPNGGDITADFNQSTGFWGSS